MARNMLIALEAYSIQLKNYTTNWLQTWNNIAYKYLSTYSTDEFNMP